MPDTPPENSPSSFSSANKKSETNSKQINAVITIFKNGEIIHINALALQYLKNIQKDLLRIGEPIFKLVPAELLEDFKVELCSSFKGWVTGNNYLNRDLINPFSIKLVPDFDYEGNVGNVKVILTLVKASQLPVLNEDSFNESSDFFKVLFQHHPDAVFSFDLNGKFSNVNPSALVLSEGNLDQLIHQDFAPMIEEKDRSKVFIHFKNALNGHIQNYNAAFLSLRGTKKILNITNFPIYNQNAISGVFGIAKDITTYESEKLQIKSGYNRFKKILDQSLDLICTIDKNGIFTEVSAASQKIIGYKPDELKGKKYLEFVHPEDMEKTLSIAVDIKNGIEKTNFSNRYISKSGNPVPIIWSARWDLDEHLMYCAGRDASEIILAEKIILQERSMLKAIIDNIPDHIFAIDKHHKTILTNRKFYSEYLGKTSEKETLGLKPIDYFSVEEGEQIMEDNSRVMETGKPVINRRDVVYDHKGKKEVILLTKVPFKTEGGELAGLVGIARDITDSYNFEKEQKLIYKLIRSLGKAPDHITALQKTIKKISGFFNFTAAEAWEVGFDKVHIRKVADFAEEERNFEKIGNTTQFLKDEGLPGITWQNKEMEIWENLQFEERFFRQNLIKKNNISLGIGVPVIVKEEVIAVLVFFGDGEQNGSQLKPALHRIAIQLGTEIKRKMAENQLNNMFNFSPNLIAVIGLDGYLKKVNPAFSRIFGYTEEELLNTPFMQFLHIDEKGYTYERLKEVAGGFTPKSFQNRCRAKNGEWKWVSWIPSELIDEEGIVHLFGIDITPIKTLNMELLQYRNLIESSKDGIAFITLEPERVFLNSAIRKILGLPQDQEYSRLDVESFYADKKTAKKIFSSLLGGKYYNGDIQLKDFKGEFLDYQLSGGPVYNEAGELIAVYGLHTDVKERKAYESSLRAYGERINNILESITDGFFSLNTQWEVTYWNKEAEKLTMVNRRTVINKNLWDQFEGARKLPFYQKLKEAMEKGEKVRFEEYFLPLKKWFDISAYPGKEGLSVYFRDITEKKRVDEQIRAAKERYDLVAKATREAVYDWDIVSNSLEWSDVYFQIYGYEIKSKHESLDQWVDNIHSEDRDLVVENLDNAIKSNTIKWECEYRLIKKNKQIAWVLERGFIIRNREGKALRMIGALQDITQLKENEKALEELNHKLQKHANDLSVSNAELEQFAYIASHDLQEPLRMVTSFLTQLQRKYNDQLDDKGRQYIHFATDGAVRMRQIILDLLEYSRVGKLNYDFEEVDLNILMKDIILLHENLILDTSAVIKFHNLPLIRAAVTPIQRVLSNLISNSIKYCEKEPIIEITVLDCDKHWQINVSDNGIGIDEQFQEKIFIIFQRLHSRDHYSGTGIGLAICKKIVENHGGKIWVTSKEGEGSTFHFTILKHF